MAIAVDTTVTSITNGYAGGPTTKTWTHTCTGSNLLLVLCADTWQDVGGTGVITAASYNSVAMTKITQLASVNMSSEMWYLPAPASGSHTVSVTFTGAHDAIKYATTSLTGVVQTSPLDASHTATGTLAGSPTASLTTLTANVGVIGTLSRYSTTAATTSNTSLYNDATGSMLGASDFQLASVTGVYTDTYLGSATDDWAMIMASFIPVSSVSATVAQTHATLTFTGGTQAVAPVNYAAVSQAAATLTFTGGTQAVALNLPQSHATLTFTGGTQSILAVDIVTIAQSGATLTFTGGTQASRVTAATTQSHATLTFTGGTQVIKGINFVSWVSPMITVTSGGKSFTVQSGGKFDNVTSGGNIETVTSGNKNETVTSGSKNITITGSEKMVNL